MALINYKREPSEKTYAAIRKPKDDAERIAQHCANDYWLNLCQSIELSADYGNHRGMYDGMRKVLGPCINKIMPLKSTSGTIITERSKQMDRWVEHDIPPSVEELSTATNSPACGSSRLEKGSSPPLPPPTAQRECAQRDLRPQHHHSIRELG